MNAQECRTRWLFISSIFPYEVLIQANNTCEGNFKETMEIRDERVSLYFGAKKIVLSDFVYLLERVTHRVIIPVLVHSTDSHNSQG